MVDLLVITSCVMPPQQQFLKLVDSKERMRQTKQCLDFFISSRLFRYIVICDGSNVDCTDQYLKNKAENNDVRLESLFFLQNFEKVRLFGKGYGEGEIMEHIVKNSILFEQSKFFIKITGRLSVNNIRSLLMHINTSSIYFNIFPARKLGCVDTRLYGMPTDKYEHYFLSAYKQVNDSQRRSFEYCFTDVLQVNKLKFIPFAYVPIFDGLSGTKNRRYSKDLVYWTEYIFNILGLMNTKIASIAIFVSSLLSKVIDKVR